MDDAATGLLQAVSLDQRIKLERELGAFFQDVSESLEDARRCLYDLQRSLDRTSQGATTSDLRDGRERKPHSG